MNEDYIPDNIEWAWFWCYNVAAVCMLILCILHSCKVYQDLHTKERKCLNHRKSKPKLTKEYKFVQYLTLAILFLHLCDSSLFGLEMASHYSHWTLQDCRNLNNAGGWFLLIGKGCMYMLFMYRLHHVYHKSVYGYNKKILVSIGWFNVIFGIACEAFTTYLTIHHWSFFQDIDEFPNPCGPINDSMLVGFFPITMQVWDAIMNVLSLTLFIYPLWKGFHRVHTDNRANENMTSIMIYIALKYSILTFVAFITTLCFWLLVHVAPEQYYLVAFDVVINSVCIMLMTAYYPDNQYYEKICCCFLMCCKVNLQQSKSNECNLTTEVQSDIVLQMQSGTCTKNESGTIEIVHVDRPTIQSVASNSTTNIDGDQPKCINKINIQ